jgi:hypothetical protein
MRLRDSLLYVCAYLLAGAVWLAVVALVAVAVVRMFL